MKRPSHEGSDTEGQGKAEIDVAANHDDFLLLRSRPFSLINVSAAFRVMGVAFRAYAETTRRAAAQSDFRLLASASGASAGSLARQEPIARWWSRLYWTKPSGGGP